MKAYDGYKAEKASGREILPAGGYVCIIKSAKEETFDWGKRLVLAIDVAEGQFAGFFKKDYEQNTREDKKWRGTYRINEPKDDGSEKDGWAKRTFNNFIWSIQESNPGFTWDWDEKKLKNLKLGVLYRNKEWEMDGRTGWTTEAAGSCSVDDIRSGSFKPLKDKPLDESKKAAAATAPVFEEASDDGDLPF